MLRGRSRAVTKQTLAADHRSAHSHPTPTQNRQQQNPAPLSRFLLKFRQFSAGGTHGTPFSENTTASRNRGTTSSDRGQRRSWELESDSRGISLIVAAGRSKRVLFGTEVGLRTVDPVPDSPVSSDDPAREPNTPPAAHIFINLRFTESYYLVSRTEADAKTRGRNSKTGESFLSSCYTCKKMIEPTADIYIYRYNQSIKPFHLMILNSGVDGFVYSLLW